MKSYLATVVTVLPDEAVTRLSLGFSKKLENLEAAVATFLAYYNYVWRTRLPDRKPKQVAEGEFHGEVGLPWAILARMRSLGSGEPHDTPRPLLSCTNGLKPSSL